MKAFQEDLFYQIDCFKVPFHLFFRNRRKSSTIKGSLFSLIIYAIIPYLFFTSNLILKTNPNVIDQMTTEDHAPLIELNPENFEIVAGVTNSLGKAFNDPSIFKIQFVQIEIGFDWATESKKILKTEVKNTTLCRHHVFQDHDAVEQFEFENYTCVENGNFELEGGFVERMVKAVVVMISYCNNDTDGIICKSQGEINNFFKDKGLWLYFQDDIYEVSNYEKPIKKNWRIQSIQCAAVPRIVDIYLKKLIFINDDQVIFSNDKTSIGFMKERVEALSGFQMIDSPVISMNFFSSKNNQKTYRKYQKLMELIANIGGVINVLLIIGNVLTGMQNQLEMQNSVMNSIYDYSFEKKERLPNKKKKTEGKTIKDCEWSEDYDERFHSSNATPKHHDANELKTAQQLMKDSINEAKITRVESKEIVILKSNNNVNIEDKTFISQKEPLKFDPSNVQEANSPLKIDLSPAQNSIEESSEIRINFDKRMIPRKSVFNNLKLKEESPMNGPKLDSAMSPKVKQKDLNITCKWPERITPTEKVKKKIWLTVYDYLKLKIKSIFRRKLTKKEQLFQISEKKFKNETDIIYILQKIQEFEKLKIIMLDEKQLRLFNLIAKPLIYLESQREKIKGTPGFRMSITKNWENPADTKMRVDDLKAHYYALSNEQNLSSVDKNLLNLIEKNVFDI